ncbi:MAG: TIGR03620 family F420-dependent LLM class oxidoreductase [Pseudomonadales bacterium]|jgi:probable F420-dependent oxidoreductase|nr:TIGR03620 family F420-dependent LLM class oxidoreductase [Pseudomonadales bacterium]
MDTGRLGVWYFTETMAAQQAAEAAQRIEALGYGTLWIPETTGRNPMAHAAWLLANTRTLNLATGIANIYHREPGVTLSAQNTLAEQSGGRFLLGMGVSHRPLVEGVRGLEYGPPVATMRKYLEAMDQAPYSAVPPAAKPKRVIAALGPKMLETARDLCDGAHPYFTSPDHTQMAREILGPDRMLCVEQKVVLETDATRARELARGIAQIYIGLPNYRNNWLRMGLTEEDLAGAGSDRFIDATFAWGTVEAIKSRIKAHFDAGATHVCLQPVNPNGVFGDLHWDALEALADAA